MAANKLKKDRLNMNNIYTKLINHTNDGLRFDMQNYLWHPTRIPLVIGAIWFIFVGSAQINNTQSTLNSDQTSLLLLEPCMLLLGLSGLITLLKDESVGRFGRIYRGFWAQASGVFSIAVGWGIGFVLILAYIFR